jgi:hypothetical protein
MRIACAALLAAWFVLAIQPAHARRTLEVKSVTPSAAALSKNGAATFTLLIHAQGTDTCLAIISAGDGERPRSLQFGPGKPDTQTLRLTFRKVGRYVIDIGPREGQTDCTKAQAVVSVHPEGSDQPAARARPEPVTQATPKPAKAAETLLDRNAKEKLAAACPDGWSMASNDGTRFTCRLIPPRALACPAGTTYFTSGTQIGCK